MLVDDIRNGLANPENIVQILLYRFLRANGRYFTFHEDLLLFLWLKDRHALIIVGGLGFRS